MLATQILCIQNSVATIQTLLSPLLSYPFSLFGLFPETGQNHFVTLIDGITYVLLKSVSVLYHDVKFYRHKIVLEIYTRIFADADRQVTRIRVVLCCSIGRYIDYPDFSRILPCSSKG